MKPVRHASILRRQLGGLAVGLVVAGLAVAPIGASGQRQPPHRLASPAPVIIKTTPGGFHWGDAAIGAAGATAIALIALGLSTRTRDQRRLGIDRGPTTRRRSP